MTKEDAMEHQKASLMKAMAEKMGTERFPAAAKSAGGRAFKSSLGGVAESPYEGPTRGPRGPYRPREAQPLAGSTASDTAAAISQALAQPKTIKDFFSKK